MHPLLAEGLTDAVGFVAGALAALGVATLVGVDPFAPGYGTSSIVGIVLLGIGGGAGLQLARRWRRGRQDKP